MAITSLVVVVGESIRVPNFLCNSIINVYHVILYCRNEEIIRDFMSILNTIVVIYKNLKIFPPICCKLVN